jgi:hypothetical protein
MKQEVIYQNDVIIVETTEHGRNFIATVENLTDSGIALEIGGGSCDIGPHDWVGVTNDEQGRGVLEAIKAGDFTVRQGYTVSSWYQGEYSEWPGTYATEEEARQAIEDDAQGWVDDRRNDYIDAVMESRRYGDGGLYHLRAPGWNEYYTPEVAYYAVVNERGDCLKHTTRDRAKYDLIHTEGATEVDLQFLEADGTWQWYHTYLTREEVQD